MARLTLITLLPVAIGAFGPLGETTCPTGSECAAGQQCYQGRCHPCINGQYCSSGSVNTEMSVIANVCPAKSLCNTSAVKEVCPIGYSCPQGTFGSATTGNLPANICPAVRWFPSSRTPLLPWCLTRFCGYGTMGNTSLCPKGKHCTSPSQSAPCPAGFFCVEGGTEPTRCEHSWGADPTKRCPEGSSGLPMSMTGFWWCIVVILPCFCLLLEMLHTIVEVRMPQWDARRFDASDGAGSVIRFVEEQTVLLGMNMSANIVDSIGELSSGRGRNKSQDDEGNTSKSNTIVNLGDAMAPVGDALGKVGSGITMAFNRVASGGKEGVKIALQVAEDSVGKLSGGSARGSASSPSTRKKLVRKQTLSRISLQHSPESLEAIQVKQEVVADAKAMTGEEGMKVSGNREFVRLGWHGLSFVIGGSNRILNNLDGHIEQGELVALMGESGSGKSTMLNVLGGRAGYGKISGSVTLNDRPYDPFMLKHMIGFVLQEYILYDELTVFENLVYSAKLRGGKDDTTASIKSRCETTLRLLGLQNQRNFTLDKDLGIGRLSGGQMRRVGIGVELVTNPALLLLDEPTSALDAVNTRIVVNILKMLAESGLCVVASIHQPRLSAYESFSKLLLLSKGELVYGGRCGVLGEAVSYFAGHGYVCPPRINPADFFIEICFGFVKSETVEYDELSELWRTEYHRQVAARDAHKPMQHEGVSREDWRTFLEEEMYFCTLDLDEVVPESYARAMELPRESGLNGPSWAQLHAQVRSWQMPAPDQPGLHWQFILCLQRFLIKRLRMRVMIMSSHLVVVVLSLVCGFVNGPQVKSSSLTFLVIFICLFSTYTASLAIETIAQGANNMLYTHEACGGVSQYAELMARFIGDIITWFLLPVMYIWPFVRLTNILSGYGSLIALFWMQWWAMTPIGYLFCVVFGKQQASCITAALTLILGVFLSTQLGPTLAEAPGLLTISAPRWAAQALLNQIAFHMPFGMERARLESRLVQTGLMPVVPRALVETMRGDNGSSTNLDDVNDPINRLARAYFESLIAYEMGPPSGDTKAVLREQLLGCYDRFLPYSNVFLPTNVPGGATSIPMFGSIGRAEFNDVLDTVQPDNWWWRCILALFVIGLVLRLLTLIAFVYKFDGLPRWMHGCCASSKPDAAKGTDASPKTATTTTTTTTTTTPSPSGASAAAPAAAPAALEVVSSAAPAEVELTIAPAATPAAAVTVEDV